MAVKEPPVYCRVEADQDLFAHPTQLSALGGLGLTVPGILLYRWRRPRRWQRLGLTLPACLGANLGNATPYTLAAMGMVGEGPFPDWGGFVILGCLATISVLSLVVVARCIRFRSTTPAPTLRRETMGHAKDHQLGKA